MKKLILFFLTIVPFCLKAQNASIQIMGDVIYVLNEKKVTKAEFDAVAPTEIIEAKPLKSAEAVAAYGPAAANGAFVMLTKKFAIAAYQEKLSQLCKGYKSYLASHGNDDGKIAYDLDGKQLPKDSFGILALYHLPKEKIGGNVFTEKEPAGTMYTARIVITTKK